MACVYTVETYSDWYRDSTELVKKHYSEVAVGKYDMCIDHRQFQWMQQNGHLHVVMVRDEGKLVGYHISVLRRHLHRDVEAAYTDAFYIDPQYRAGRVAYKMFKFAEDTLRVRGVGQLYSSVKTSKDIGRLLEAQGSKHVENVYLKEL